MTFEIADKKSGKRVLGHGVRHLKFALLIARGYKPSFAKKMSGFAPGYATKDILSNSKTIKATKTVQENREILQQIPGLTFFDSMLTAQEIRDNDENNPDTQLRANRQLIEGMGYNAPVEINTEERTLAISLDGSDIKELYKLQQELSPV